MWVRTSVHPTTGHNFFHSDAHKLTAHLPPNTVLKLQSTTTRQDRSWRGNVPSFMIVHKEEAEKEERTGVSGECWDQWAVDLDSNTETILWLMSSKAIWLFEHIHARKKKKSDPVVKLAWVTSRCWWTNNRTTTNTHTKKSDVTQMFLTDENFLRFERRWKRVMTQVRDPTWYTTGPSCLQTLWCRNLPCYVFMTSVLTTHSSTYR